MVRTWTDRATRQEERRFLWKKTEPCLTPSIPCVEFIWIQTPKSRAIDSHSTMSPTTEHGTKCRVPMPELVSTATLVDNSWQVAVREGPSASCKMARLLDEGGLLDGNDLLDEGEDDG